MKKIVESLKYYVNTRNIRFKSTANGFITVIKEYFTYLYKERKINNHIFTTIEGIEVLNNLVKKTVNELKLKSNNKQKKPISEEIFYKINEECNKIIDEITLEQINSFDKKIINLIVCWSQQ